MTADTANRFWLGKVALAKSQVRAEGPVAKLLTVLPLAKGRFGPYRTRLQSAGGSGPFDACRPIGVDSVTDSPSAILVMQR